MRNSWCLRFLLDGRIATVEANRDHYLNLCRLHGDQCVYYDDLVIHENRLKRLRQIKARLKRDL